MPEPTNLNSTVAASTMKSPGEGLTESKYDQISANSGTSAMLSVATVIQVDYEKHEVTLRIENGETFENFPIGMTYPSSGARHFLGALPLPGDVALVGWGSLESGRSRQPFVLGWFAGGVMGGHDWWLTQPMGQDEHNMTPKERARWEGIANRTRHKLRHMLPGNVVASSAQGSDLVLDEGVLLANRRGNELRLRDQDQAFIVRSLQQFHAGAGFRMYSGLVQRDATFLPTALFSDGIFWDAPAQVDAEGLPLQEGSLGTDPIAANNLTPNAVFQKNAEGTQESGLSLPGNLDPYTFLQKGLLIDANGRPTAKVRSDAVYGGKSMYRVSTDNSNAVIDPDAEALTEYRVEVAHTSDGRLPVTEQTDGFDADRLPDSVPRLSSPLNDSTAMPFIEFVLGSVVGNDPFSLIGKSLYGVPLRPQIFLNPKAQEPNPALASGVGFPMGEHAAALFRLSPPLNPSADPTFWTVTKDGRVKASIAGPGTSYSAELYFGAGLAIGTGAAPGGRGLDISSAGVVSLRAEGVDNQSNVGVEITATTGAVVIQGSGNTTAGGGAATPTGVTIQSSTGILLSANTDVTIAANALILKQTSNLTLASNAQLALSSGQAMSQTSNTRDITSMGKTTETYSGPKNGLPTNGAARSVTIATTPATGFVGGPADMYTLVYGDKVETIATGNHISTVAVGNRLYTVGAGSWTVAVGASSIAITPASLSVTSGAVTITGTGVVAINGAAAVNILAAGTGGVRATPGSVMLVAVGSPKFGGIVSQSDLDPTSGLPLGLLGMGSFQHLLSNV
jgi:hypothetical protein